MSKLKIETYDSTVDEKARKLASSKASTQQDRSNFVAAVVDSAKASTDVIVRKISGQVD